MREVQTTEELKDVYQHFLLHYGADLPKMRNTTTKVKRIVKVKRKKQRPPKEKQEGEEDGEKDEENASAAEEGEEEEEEEEEVKMAHIPFFLENDFLLDYILCVHSCSYSTKIRLGFHKNS